MDEAKLAEIEARIPSAATQCMWCDRLATLRCKGCGGLLCDEHRDYLRDESPCGGDATEPVTHDHATADRTDLVAEVRRLTAALVPPQRPCVGDVVMFEGNRCTVTAVDEQRFYAEDHDWRTSIAPDWSEMEFARPVWIARLRGRGSAQNAKRGGAK